MKKEYFEFQCDAVDCDEVKRSETPYSPPGWAQLSVSSREKRDDEPKMKGGVLCPKHSKALLSMLTPDFMTRS